MFGEEFANRMQMKIPNGKKLKKKRRNKNPTINHVDEIYNVCRMSYHTHHVIALETK
jgi:hypothetical protein